MGELFDKIVFDNIEKGLVEFFYSIGKYNVKVDVIIIKLLCNCVKLLFKFDEGDVVFIC